MSLTQMSTDLTPIEGCALMPYHSVEDWLEARKPIIGASESPGILGHGYANESAYSTWARKLGRMPPLEDSEALECGRILQPSIIELFRRRFMRECPERIAPDFKVHSLGEFTICRSLEYEFLGCTLDGLFYLIELADGYALVECKNVSIFMGREWRPQEEPDEDDEFEELMEVAKPRIVAPLRVQIQAQHQMATNPKFVRCFIVGLIGGNKLVWQEVERDDEFISVLIPAVKEFHYQVLHEVAPPIDGSVATSAAIKALHPYDNGTNIVLPDIAQEWHYEFEKAKLEYKQAKARKRLFRNLLTNEIGDATYGILPDGTRYSLKTAERPEATRTVKAAHWRTLRYTKN